MDYRKISSLKTAAQFQSYTFELGIELPVDEQLESGPQSPLAQPVEQGGIRLATSTRSGSSPIQRNSSHI